MKYLSPSFVRPMRSRRLGIRPAILLLVVPLLVGGLPTSPAAAQPAPPPAAPAAPADAAAAAAAQDAREAAFRFVLAKMLAAEGDVAGAGEAFRDALDLAPDQPFLLLEHAAHLVRLADASRGARRDGLLELALEQATRARDLAGDEPAVWRTLAEVYYDLARNRPALQSEAMEAMERVVEADPDDLESALTLGQLYLNGDQPERAVDLFARVAERTSGNRYVYSMLGEALMRTGRMAEAEGVLERLLVLDPSSRQVRLGLAGLLSERGDHAASLRVLQEAPRGLRDQPEVQRRIALETLFSGRPEEAREGVDALYAEEPDSPPVLGARALVLAEQGDLEELDRMVAELPADDSRRRELAALLQQWRQGAAAERILRRTLAALEGGEAPAAGAIATVVRFQLADLLRTEGDLGSAAALLAPLAERRDLEARRNVVVAHAELLQEAGRFDEALRALGDLDRKTRSEPAIQGLRAELLLAAGRERQAVRLLDRLAAEPEGAVAAARAAQARQRYDLSLPILEALEESGEAGPSALFMLAAAYERTGRTDRSEEVFLRLLEEEPEFHPAQNYLAFMWAEEGRHLDRALELVRRAVQAQPDSGSYLDSLAWVHYRLGEYELALKYLQRAARLEPGEPEILEHLGDVHAAVGDVESARRAYRRALDLVGSGDADRTAELERKIDDLRPPLRAPRRTP